MTSQSKLHFGRETKSAPEVGWKSINPKYQLTGTSQKHVTVNQSYLATQQLKCTTEHKKKTKNKNCQTKLQMNKKAYLFKTTWSSNAASFLQKYDEVKQRGKAQRIPQPSLFT